MNQQQLMKQVGYAAAAACATREINWLLLMNEVCFYHAAQNQLN